MDRNLLKQLRLTGGDPLGDDLGETLALIEESIMRLRSLDDDSSLRRTARARTGSRFLDQGASPSLVEHVAKGGSYGTKVGGYEIEPNHSTRSQGRRSRGLAYGMKALAEGTGSAGGYLVPVEVSAEIVKLIRARSAVMRLGPRVVPVKKELDVTSVASGATAY